MKAELSPQTEVAVKHCAVFIELLATIPLALSAGMLLVGVVSGFRKPKPITTLGRILSR